MNFEFVPLNKKALQTIADWEYSDGSSLYMSPYFNSSRSGNKLKGPGGCDGFAAFVEGEIAGLFEYTFREGWMIIGLAIHPKLQGKGLGTDLTLQGIRFGIDYYDYSKKLVKLSVALDNTPAIRIYKKLGFVEIRRDDQEMFMQIEVKKVRR